MKDVIIIILLSLTLGLGFCLLNSMSEVSRLTRVNKQLSKQVTDSTYYQVGSRVYFNK